ncbi:MAG: carboxypeptidase regulatory-like domain-containing protein [Edaphobacter sp.]
MQILRYPLLRKPRLLSASGATLLAFLFAVPSLCEGATVKGVVTNKTTNKPDAGDEVVLVALTQNMQDIARTRTDGAGRYSIELPDAGMHLIRVVHQKAAYFAAVTPGKTQVDVDVYDVEPKLEGVTTEAQMVRVETDPQGLHVVESYFVMNESRPQRTQFGPKAYEIFLPAGVQIEASVAMGPGGMPVASPPVPAGDSGHYSFVFPVRPGETRFQVSYHVPYSGSYSFQPRVSLPTANLAIALPKSMTFVAGAGTSFQPLNDDANAQTFLTKNVQPSLAIAFTVSGNGSLPRGARQGQDNQPQTGAAATGSAADTRPGIGLGAPIDTPDPLDKYKWWLLSGFALVFVIAVALFLRSRTSPSPAVIGGVPFVSPPSAVTTHSAWLTALRDGLFVLETDRLKGNLTETEYREQKAAFETLLRRALNRYSSSASQVDPTGSAETSSLTQGFRHQQV